MHDTADVHCMFHFYKNYCQDSHHYLLKIYQFFFSLKRKYGEVAKGKHVIYHLHIIFRFRIINNKFISVCMIMAINTKQFVLILIKAVNELIVLYMFKPCLVTRRK